MAEQGPGLDRNDRRLVRPLLGELTPPVDQVVEQRLLVRPEAREQDLVLRRREHVEVVDLQQAELTDHPPQSASPTRPLDRPRSKPCAASAIRRASLAEKFALLRRCQIPRHRVVPPQPSGSPRAADSTVQASERESQARAGCRRMLAPAKMCR